MKLEVYVVEAKESLEHQAQKAEKNLSRLYDRLEDNLKSLQQRSRSLRDMGQDSLPVAREANVAYNKLLEIYRTPEAKEYVKALNDLYVTGVRYKSSDPRLESVVKLYEKYS